MDPAGPQELRRGRGLDDDLHPAILTPARGSAVARDGFGGSVAVHFDSVGRDAVGDKHGLHRFGPQPRKLEVEFRAARRIRVTFDQHVPVRSRREGFADFNEMFSDAGLEIRPSRREVDVAGKGHHDAPGFGARRFLDLLQPDEKVGLSLGLLLRGLTSRFFRLTGLLELGSLALRGQTRLLGRFPLRFELGRQALDLTLPLLFGGPLALRIELLPQRALSVFGGLARGVSVGDLLLEAGLFLLKPDGLLLGSGRGVGARGIEPSLRLSDLCGQLRLALTEGVEFLLRLIRPGKAFRLPGLAVGEPRVVSGQGLVAVGPRSTRRGKMFDGGGDSVGSHRLGAGVSSVSNGELRL